MPPEGRARAGKRGTPGQLGAKLRRGEGRTAQGKPVAGAVGAIGVSEPSLRAELLPLAG